MWNIVDKYEVNKLYTSPTAVRALSALGDKWVKECVFFRIIFSIFAMTSRMAIVSIKLSESSCVKARLTRNVRMNYAQREAEFPRKSSTQFHVSCLPYSFNIHELSFNLTATVFMMKFLPYLSGLFIRNVLKSISTEIQ